jgi:hypothetical protein
MNRMVDNIKTDIQETGFGSSGSGQGHVAGFCIQGEPFGVIRGECVS